MRLGGFWWWSTHGAAKIFGSFQHGWQRHERGGNMKRAIKGEYDFSKAKRGPVVSVPKGKTRITIRIDDDVLEWFHEQADRAGGGNYQTLINEALRQHIRRVQEPLENTIRRVIREELSHSAK